MAYRATYEGDSLADWVDSAKKPTSRAARRMADKGGEHMTSLTKDNTPVGEWWDGQGWQASGHLRRSFDQKPIVVYKDERGFTIYETGVETSVDYAPDVEYGTGLWGPNHAKYEITPKKPGGWLSWVTRKPFTTKKGKVIPAGTRMFAKRVMHPGSPGNHMVAIAVAATEIEFDTLMRPILSAWTRDADTAWLERKGR